MVTRCSKRRGKKRRRNLRAENLKNRYNLTEKEVDAMIENVLGCCEICGIYKGRRLVVDHNHRVTSDSIRGLLCSNCNCGLGLLLDDPVILKRAIKYLEKHK